MRLFVAGYPPPAALDHLATAVDQLRLGAAAAAGTNVRLVARPLWHLTLAFLGEVPPRQVPDAQAALTAAVTGWDGTPPQLRLAGGGRFGGRRFAVLWVGLAGNVAALGSLGDAVRRQLRRARLPYDRKPWRPHLTFARPGDRLPAADLAADVATLRGYEGPQWTLDAVYLVSSQLGPKPVHTRLASLPVTPTPPILE